MYVLLIRGTRLGVFLAHALSATSHCKSQHSQLVEIEGGGHLFMSWPWLIGVYVSRIFVCLVGLSVPCIIARIHFCSSDACRGHKVV